VPVAPAVAGAWWLAFNDPVLNRLETEALSDNLTIEIALARIDQSRGALRTASAALWPSGIADGTAARSRQSLNSGLGQLSRYVPSLPRTVDFGQAKLSASWDLDFAGGRRRQREGAHADAARAAAGLEAARLGVTADVADAYLSVHGLQLQRAAIQRLANLLEDQRGIMSVRVRVGASPAEALEASTAIWKDAQALLPSLDAQVQAQHNRLAVLLGRSPSESIDEPGGAGLPIAPDPAAGVPADILRHRPDVLAAEQALISANAAIGAALAEYYPEFSLSALLGQESNGFGSFFSADSTTAQGVLGLRWRLFDFGRLRGQVALARGRTREALAAYQDTVLRASEEVETAFAVLHAARTRVALLLERRAAAAAMAVSDERGFRTGEQSRDHLLNAERAVAVVDADLAAAQQDEARAVVACHRALGAPTETSTGESIS